MTPEASGSGKKRANKVRGKKKSRRAQAEEAAGAFEVVPATPEDEPAIGEATHLRRQRVLVPPGVSN
eukprot:scaffold205087_cov46-Prasinocladus_malaysianus.AAC.1